MGKLNDSTIDRDPKGFKEHELELLEKKYVQPFVSKKEWDFCKLDKLRAEADEADRGEDIWESHYD